VDSNRQLGQKKYNLKFTLKISIVQYKLGRQSGRQVSEVTDLKRQGLCYDIL
jgi:hypothetical protein